MREQTKTNPLYNMALDIIDRCQAAGGPIDLTLNWYQKKNLPKNLDEIEYQTGSNLPGLAHARFSVRYSANQLYGKKLQKKNQRKS